MRDGRRDGPHRVGYRGPHRLRQADAVTDVGDLAADDDGPRRRAAERAQAGEHRGGIHAVRVQTGWGIA